MNLKIIGVIILSVFVWQKTISQNDKVPITNYTNREYGRGYQEQNWCILLDNRDVVYAGNANGILEYDGSTWNFIPVKRGAFIFSLAKDTSGRIFVGSQNEFGFLAPTRLGKLQYYSLSDSLNEQDKFFTIVWKTHVYQGTVYFQSDENLFIYQDDNLQVFYPEDSYHTSFLLHDRFFIRERYKGLMEYSGGEFSLVPGGEFFADLGIFAMLPIDDSRNIFIATQEKGFFILNPENKSEPLVPLPNKYKSFLIQAEIIGGIALDDGNYAFNTVNEGIIITDQAGEIINIINKETGLRVNDVKQIWQDNNQNIWCALNNGISRIDYASPTSYYKEESGIFGSVNSVISYNNRIYVGTTNGLYVEKAGMDHTKSMEFEAFPSFTHQVWDLIAIGNDLLAGTNAGLFLIKGSRTLNISSLHAYKLYYQPDLKLLFVAGNQGLAAFIKKNSWEQKMRFDLIGEDVVAICENKSTLYEGKELWLGTRYQGAIKIIIKPDYTYETFKYYGAFDGLNEDWILAFSFRDSVLFGTRTGIFGFTDEEIIKETLPDSLKENPEFTRGFFEGRNIFNHTITTPVYYITEDELRTWIDIDNEAGYISNDATDTIVTKPFMGIDMGKINVIYPQGNEVCWIGAADGLVKFVMDFNKDFEQKFNTLIRQITLTEDSTLFLGAHFSIKDENAPILELGLHQSHDLLPELSFRYNSVRFYFSAPFYDDEVKNQFSFYLEGYDDELSPWSDQKQANYTNLHEGEYTFKVKAKNVYGQESELAEYSFSILPPWYRTIWAYIGYFILFVIILYFAVQISLIRLRRKNERLEQIVRERTVEIRKQNIELALQKKEITDSIEYALRIQKAVLPSEQTLHKKFPDYFILFKPRDIVSGDFYWLADTGKKIIVIAADCTGHGVPGAFMSMLGVSFLNKIVNENKIYSANQILNQLRENVIKSLQQTGKEGEQKDGMDMGLCVIDFENMNMEFAGANNPLYLIRDNELNETKADRMPVAHYVSLDDFNSHSIHLKSGDRFYMFSDGYADQFGGPNGKKFKYKPFKELLMENKDKPMSEQKEILDRTIEEWKAVPNIEGKPYDQVDDILVVGIHIQ